MEVRRVSDRSVSRRTGVIAGFGGVARTSRLLTVIDLAGTLVFAIEGAMMAVRYDLDLLGIIVLACATALGGGIMRDVVLGATPPQALRSWHYPAVAFGGGAIVFAGADLVQHIPRMVMIDLDAVGLALFAVAGTEKALDYGMPSLIAICLGAITAVGGGTVRDVLLTHVPAVLRIDVYATAALAGAALMVAARRLGASPALSALLGGLFCFGLRVVSVW